MKVGVLALQMTQMTIVNCTPHVSTFPPQQKQTMKYFMIKLIKLVITGYYKY